MILMRRGRHTPARPNLQPGDCCGEMGLVDGEPRSAAIVATTDLQVLVVDRSQLGADERILTISSHRVRRLEGRGVALLAWEERGFHDPERQ
jgi:CRP-like cAMP-binding protein